MKYAQKVMRMLLILLALAMLLSTFAACATEDEDVVSTEGDDIEDSTEPINDGFQHGGPWDGWALDEDGYIKDRLPADMNFEDEFLILASSSQKKHFWADEADTTPVGQAIYKRNETVAERLGITLEWNPQANNSIASMAEADIKSGNEFDCVISYNLHPYPLAAKGLLVNLNATDNIDLEAPWWPQEYLSSLLYKDQIYALVNNSGVGTLTNLSCIFFNNDLLEAKKIESPYDLVAKNEWTIPKLKELIKDTYEDTNGNGSAEGGEGGDLYGLVTSTAARITCWYYAAGLRFSTVNESGELVFNTDVEDATTRIEAIVDLFSTKDSLVNEPGLQYVMFKDNRAYFYLSVVSMASNMVSNNIEIDYGVAPNPKLNSEQSRYYTHVPNTHDAWFLLKGTKDTDCSSAFIECMASEAYRQVNKVFFEDTIKLRYAPGEELADMYDLIRESITFDFVFVYSNVIGTDINKGIRNCIQMPDQYKWATVWAGIKDSMNTKFQTVLDTYEQNAAG
ncbi:MAG: hypothetical protein IJX19_00665 [Clostridia bacterium]|nr:hypothetical protein [Clostridia bacterium]